MEKPPNKTTRLPIILQEPERGSPGAPRSTRAADAPEAVHPVAAAIMKATPRSDLPTAGEAVRSVYIHVPFCFHKCHYCDFYSIVDTRDRQAEFSERLSRELAAQAPAAAGTPVRSIFVGGGTPSLLRVDLWDRILRDLNQLFDLSEIRSGVGEFTVECNPETVTPELMACLRSGGVNRVSVGAQSFEPRHLKTLERWHDPANVGRALEMAAAAGIERRSVDLIFGIPGQTVAEWQRDLETAIALGVGHLSCYNLTYEPNTAMTARLRRGDFTPADEDIEVEMFDTTLRTLRASGFDRYEVSNFARMRDPSGGPSRHNLAYWLQEDWLALGPSASGHIAGCRWKNTPRLDDYLTHDRDGFTSIVDVEPADAARNLRESIMTGLRLTAGLDAGAIIRRAAEVDTDAPDRLRRAVMTNIGRGWLDPDHDDRWKLTDAGFMFVNTVARDLMQAVR